MSYDPSHCKYGTIILFPLSNRSRLFKERRTGTSPLVISLSSALASKWAQPRCFRYSMVRPYHHHHLSYGLVVGERVCRVELNRDILGVRVPPTTPPDLKKRPALTHFPLTTTPAAMVHPLSHHVLHTPYITPHILHTKYAHGPENDAPNHCMHVLLLKHSSQPMTRFSSSQFSVEI